MFNVGDTVYHKSELFGHGNYVKGIVTHLGLQATLFQVKFENEQQSQWWMKESEIEAPMKTVEEFFAHSTCLNSMEKVFAFVKETAEKTGDKNVPFYRVQNLGRNSILYAKSSWFNADKMFYLQHIQQTKDSINPEFIGDVDDFAAPELAHLKIEEFGNLHYVVGNSPEEVSFKPGDLNGIFRKDTTCAYIGKSVFVPTYSPSILEGQENCNPASLSVFTGVHDSWGFAHRIFTDYVIAKQYLEFCENDPESVARGAQHEIDCDLLDSFFDASMDDRDDNDRDYDMEDIE